MRPSWPRLDVLALTPLFDVCTLILSLNTLCLGTSEGSFIFSWSTSVVARLFSRQRPPLSRWFSLWGSSRGSTTNDPVRLVSDRRQSSICVSPRTFLTNDAICPVSFNVLCLGLSEHKPSSSWSMSLCPRFASEQCETSFSFMSRNSLMSALARPVS